MKTPSVKEGVHIHLGEESRGGGWHLLKGTLRRRGGSYDARLFFDTGDTGVPSLHAPVPTSAKGAVNDLLWLPAGVQRLRLDAGGAAIHEVEAFRVRPVSSLERRWRMLQRVLPVFWQHPAAKRRRLGLTWRAAVVDLAKAYELATRLRAHAAPPTYEDWVRRFDTLTEVDIQAIRRKSRGPGGAAFFHVLVVGPAGAARQCSLAAVEAQLHGAHAVSVLDDPLDAERLSQFNASLAHATPAGWVLVLRAGDVLPPHALFWFSQEARRHPTASILYADDDECDVSGQRRAPRFKPDWSLAHARSARFVGRALVLRTDALAAAGGLSEDDAQDGCYDAMLRVLDLEGLEAQVRHIPSVLLHCAGRPDPAADARGMAAVRRHLARRGVTADVEPVRPGCWRVRHALPAPPPKVSIIVPTRDALALTRLCIDSLRGHTRYPHYEILLVDNQSSDPAALAWMRAQEEAGAIRLLRYDAPFNYAAINNMAVAQARGQLVLLLNNDTEVKQPDWLEEMVSQVLQPGVDVVGAKLLYPNGLVQHAGDLVGVGGVANHAHAFLQPDEPGYCSRAIVAQEFSAVTAACLLTWRDRYLALGGLDAEHLPVAFNDVDYCLRVREAGGHVVWTPHAVLVHHESVSRGKDLSGQQLRRARRESAWMRRRWRHVLGRDPFYNPNLSHERPDFSLSHAPVVDKPWIS